MEHFHGPKSFRKYYNDVLPSSKMDHNFFKVLSPVMKFTHSMLCQITNKRQLCLIQQYLIRHTALHWLVWYLSFVFTKSARNRFKIQRSIHTSLSTWYYICTFFQLLKPAFLNSVWCINHVRNIATKVPYNFSS